MSTLVLKRPSIGVDDFSPHAFEDGNDSNSNDGLLGDQIGNDGKISGPENPSGDDSTESGK